MTWTSIVVIQDGMVPEAWLSEYFRFPGNTDIAPLMTQMQVKPQN